ncbi:hypothetical protein SAMN05421776_11817 [Nocardia farcinica]|uniref:Uncharacterized protein n=1 Tax=Nocardia farcinica TaxID=37329 RepID=A0A0H5NR03_NOCFR|nr:hypothetical protein DXT66_09410 [Nocardia farcinica]SLH68018.1 Uncharacterised protein [Mycobacteroides abscessus subsp. abscessus]PFW98967.1 hypothetical protein CJ469_05703 [Nocardia farcinica]PFX05900.1 hypothetical protein CJ468_05111 [Nocardia farcinica]CRY77782.1 Uncharacterised protein [Nocardia farcinica]
MSHPLPSISPLDRLRDAVVEYVSSLSPGEFAAFIAEARPPEEPAGELKQAAHRFTRNDGSHR